MKFVPNPLTRASLVAALTAGLLAGAGGVAAADAAEGAPSAQSGLTGSGPADGVYYLSIPGAALVWGKTTSCAEGAGGVAQIYRDPSKFSQKWRLIKQPSGAYLIASLCQPTTLLTDTSETSIGGFTNALYGTDGPTSALGSWDPEYDYNVAHSVEQEWYVIKEASGDGYAIVNRSESSPVNFGAELVPAN